ncbi:hypothetical protein H6F98_03950 [Microcoleus sp. FACHB-SPT15]|uniref:hypothetical protein n=1 Tax=Microcoleus sp. FACHB-SPT15 TaxID=2692830 RepID=UPI00177D89C8|nr:hypothetical protein [Microcoleus sp. FACHB-SPT15]MBD1804628.1 hypothetical protein [Microcoleus sp. FACHB-SPT15]
MKRKALPEVQTRSHSHSHQPNRSQIDSLMIGYQERSHSVNLSKKAIALSTCE